MISIFVLLELFRKEVVDLITRKLYSIGLGCKLNDASKMIYGERVLLDSSENIVRVGVSCRSCPRIDCRQRAFPPSSRQLSYNENVKVYLRT